MTAVTMSHQLVDEARSDVKPRGGVKNLGSLRNLRKPHGEPQTAEYVAALSVLSRAESGLTQARQAATPEGRFVRAHVAALRAAAAVLAVRGRPRRGAGVLNTWMVIPQVAPELATWCEIFSTSAPTRQALETGARDHVTAAAANALLAEAEMFVRVVTDTLGL